MATRPTDNRHRRKRLRISRPISPRFKPGKYFVQALLHRYETFHRADGHTVKLPMDRGEGQHWNLAPGNLYSKPQELIVEASEQLSISLDQEIPPIPDPKDTKYVRHLKIQSRLLSKF